MRQTTSARPGARTFAFVGAFIAVLGLAAACSESRRANGDSCLKDEDCLSGICSGQTCIASPTLLDAAVNGDGGIKTMDASFDAAADAPSEKDTSVASDAPPEAAKEAASDTGNTGEAGGDSSTD